MSEGLIYKAIPAIMAEIGAIGKDSKNTSQGFMFRGIDSMYNNLHSVLAKHKVFTVPRVTSDRTEERQSKSGGTLIWRILTVEYDVYAEDGSFVTVGPMIGEGMDSGDKGSNKAESIAHKYALIQLFCIPTEDIADPDAESPEVGDKKADKPRVTTTRIPTGQPTERKPHAGSSIDVKNTAKADAPKRAELLAMLETAHTDKKISGEQYDTWTEKVRSPNALLQAMEPTIRSICGQQATGQQDIF